MEAAMPLYRQLSRISWLIRRGDLAAVLVHMNDTYLIEDRLPDVPGLARIAAVVKCIRDFVAMRTGEDRTLVLHSGDFLSPSLMSNRLDFYGKQMVELLNIVGVNYVSLGNHEFDFNDDVLIQRMKEARFSAIGSNLVPPRGFPKFRKMVRWPPSNPFLAVIGLAGSVTMSAARKCGFGVMDPEETATKCLREIKQDQSIGALVALTHMDREEDRKLQSVIDLEWNKSGCAYILAGHDHDIDWIESHGSTVLSKNKANCKSLTLLLLSKSAVASPPRTSLPQPQLRELTDEDIELDDEDEESWESFLEKLPSFAEATEIVIGAWRKMVPTGMRPDFGRAFENAIREAAIFYDEELLREDVYWGTGIRNLLEWSATYACSERERKEWIRFGRGKNPLLEVNPDPVAAKTVHEWVQRRDLAMESDGGQLIKDFSGMALSAGMDATEASLRTHSTDYGNFVVDAIKEATATDIALINSGAFRIDDFVNPRITEQTLWETFLFDKAGAVSVVDLTVDEALALYSHASLRAGGGAFLQVSESRADVSRRHGRLKVAIATYLLNDRGDGYLDALAEHRGWPIDKVVESFAAIPQCHDTLVDLVRTGAQMVGYCNEVRASVVGSDSGNSLASETAQIVELIDQYLQAYEKEELPTYKRRMLVGNPRAERVPPTVAANLLELYRYVRDLILQYGIAWVGSGHYAALEGSRERFQRNIDYHLYLDKAMQYVIHRRDMLKRPRS
jgi:2',3'-cyclic-nucleotide 2'-phosphodiesterase (5'-nucleotidase family)